MHKKNRNLGPISTFLGPHASIEGILQFQGVIRLDGKVNGKIMSDKGTVIIGEKAVVHGEMVVDGAIIMGEVTGTIDARERIEVYPPGRVEGDIFAPQISIDSGATFNGNCGMRSREIAVNRFSDSPLELPLPKESGGN